MKIGVVLSNYDITIKTPYNEPLGGTESAICYFIEEMKLRNHDIIFFNKVDSIKIIDNIPHVPVVNCIEYIAQNNIVLDILIISCLNHELLQLKHIINNPNTLYCLWTGHDVDQAIANLCNDKKTRDVIDLFIFVSEWQRTRYIQRWQIPYYKTLVMRNGIGKPFEKYLQLPSNKITNSMCYCSFPTRGLVLLDPIFKEIKNKQPSSTLQIFSGLNIYRLQSETNEFKTLFENNSSIEYNEGINQSTLAEKLYNIEYLTYPNIFPETSCITVLQAMACGCLIVTSDLGALKETMGGLNEYIDINIYNFDKIKYISNYVSKLNDLMLLNESMKEKLREYNRKYILENYTWSKICQQFEQDIINIIINYRKYLETNHATLIKNVLQTFSENKLKECFENIVQIKYYPNLNQYCIVKLNEGVCLYQMNQLDLAKKDFKLCLELRNDYNINKNIALLELQRNNLLKFVKYARQAISFEFDIELANLLAEKYEMLGLYHDAIALYETIIYLDPKNVNSYNNLGNLNLLRISQLDDIDSIIQNTYGKSLELCIQLNEPRKKELVLSNIIFNNLYNWKLSDEETFNRSCVWYNYFPKIQELQLITNRLDRTKPIKHKINVGYISCDFITHPVGFMFDSILKNHNTNRFTIFCYDCCETGKLINDTVSKKLRSYNNATWRDISNTSDKEALEIIVNDDLDILVDMMGHTRNTRMNLLQYKPARVLVSYFAYPATNGLKEIDYRFTDKYASPESSQKYFIEKLYYLPNGFQCYTPPIELESNKDYTREKYKIHLCCFNNPIKLSIPTIDTFCNILKKLPEAKLFLRYCYYKSSYYKETVVKLFVTRGIERERIDIGFEPILDALKLYNKMDIVLDPFPYNGGTISSEALYMNTPIITLAGTTYYSRVGVSLLSNLGLDKYIAYSTDEYIQKVIDLANNSTELKTLHQILRLKMMNSDLANSVNFTKNIEIAYEKFVQK